jgi:hypothetical protein
VLLPEVGRDYFVRERVATIIRRIKGEIHSWGSKTLPPEVGQDEKYTHG